MSDPIVTPEPQHGEREWTYYLDTHYPAAFIDNPRNDIRIDCDRDLFMAGFAAARVLPSVEELADVIKGIAEFDPDSHDFISPTKAARAVLVYLTTKGNN